MRKIILDCDLMRFPNSGLYHYCLNLGHHVEQQLNQEGSEVIAFYVPPGDANSFGTSSECIIDRKRLFRFLQPRFKNCKVWHAPFQSGRIVPDKIKNPNTKVLLTIHDLNPLHEGKPRDEQKRSLAHTQSLIDRSDSIVCISEFCRQDVLRNCSVGNKPVHVIHNGIHKVHTGELTVTSYKPKLPFLFGMGYVNYKKHYHVLIPLLKDESLELIIAGRLDEMDYVDRIENDAIAMGVHDRLHLLGPVTEGEKGWYLQNCLAFVHPSLAEGFGAPVVEAMQFGKPLFLSSLTSLPEIGGDVAFYFNNFEPDHMQTILKTGLEKYQSNGMSEAVKKRADLFNWTEQATKYIKVYRSLL